MDIHGISLGLMVGDPLGIVARAPLQGLVDLQVLVGPRLLCPRDGPCEFPGPLVTFDALVHARPDHHAPGDVDAHVGFGFGLGTVSPGCHYDAIREFCVDDTEPSALFRVPLGADYYLGRAAVGVQIVPAMRLAPDPYPTFMGGLVLRYYVGPL